MELTLRREKLFKLLDENSVAVIFAGAPKLKSEDEFFDFQSNRNFFYFTEINQENSILMLVKGINEKKVYLFVDEYNEVKEKWTGKRLTNEQASSISEINNIYSTSSFEKMLSLALTNDKNKYGNIKSLYLDLSPELKIKDAFSVEDFKDFINNEFPHIEVKNIYPICRDLRMVKSSYEVAKIVKAINDTNNGILHVLDTIKDGQKEREIADEFEFYGRRQGSRELAFSTICAGGKNATVLHYPQQLDKVKNGELVQFDLGYKFEGYCADISRAYPVNGTFNETQRKVYECVLACNKSVIAYIKEGLTIEQLQEYTKRCLKRECVEHGLLKEEDDISRVYYHNISHHLGLDTHDISDRTKPLENGNVITVEPGLYFADLGIGIRIEDDVLINEGRAEVLSEGIKKELSDVERLLSSRR